VTWARQLSSAQLKKALSDYTRKWIPEA
jgi:hypothetical protein